MLDSRAGEIAARLDEARARTLLLVTGLAADELRAQHDPLMSPIVWDIGHIIHFEELWLTRNLHGAIRFSEMPGLYNPMEHPRSTRSALPLPSLDELLRTGSAVRAATLHELEQAAFDSTNPLLRDGYVYEMVLQHEYQHGETILQTLQLKRGEPWHPPRGRATPDVRGAQAPRGMIRVPAGRYTIGTGDHAVAYDNERPAHTVELHAFEMDAAPVTNGAYLEFMLDGGYRRRELWSDDGWRWLLEANAEAPKYWERAGETWTARQMDRVAPIEPDHPVCHVCWFEAEAFARWAGKRLPTEVEWEVAAAYDPASGTMRRFPWGSEPPSPLYANVDQLAFGTAVAGAYPANVSPLGCYGMIGDVWEWTASDFGGYPGFAAFPYPEYSEVFFGTDYKVLRGGSWATRCGAIRNTFRNWDYPIRRQIFAGFRCARDF